MNNAGILRDSSFAKMSDEDWDLMYRVHALGAYKVTKAAWPIMLEQGYGRIINTAPRRAFMAILARPTTLLPSAGLIGFTNTLAIEGARKGIKANVIAPVAGSRLTETILPKEVVEALKPEFVTPLVVKLCSEESEENGSLFEVGAGWVTKLRWERSRGAFFDPQAGTDRRSDRCGLGARSVISPMRRASHDRSGHVRPGICQPRHRDVMGERS